MILKGAIHVHSTYSYDGKESLRALRDFLLEKGVTFCCVTEHADQMTIEQAQLFVQECKALSGSQFVFIPGFEVPYKKAHILLIGTEVFLAQKADAEILKTWSSKSVLTILAHPVRNSFKLDAVMEEVIDGVEIWNQQYEGKRVPRTRSASLLRKLQSRNSMLLAFGGLDFHRKEHFGSPLFTLEVERVSSDAILHALTDGKYVFGTEKIAVSSTGLWKGSGGAWHILLSLISIFVIVAGKTVNALLALLGVSLPKGLKRAIRSRV
jgi:predicted metal-dependent phosphoesterase TrpH